MIADPNRQASYQRKDLIEAGKIRSVIDRTFTLQELAAAHAYSESERAVGKIAITVAG